MLSFNFYLAVRRGSPGAGRAKLRLSRGFPRRPACDITPVGKCDALLGPRETIEREFLGDERCPAGPHGKPRLRRSFALPAPWFPAPPPIVLELVLKTNNRKVS
jgi:hypothetical protein